MCTCFYYYYYYFDLFLHLANNYVHAHMVLLSISELFCLRKKLGRALFHGPEPWWKWQSILEVLIQIPSEIYLLVLAGAIDNSFYLNGSETGSIEGVLVLQSPSMLESIIVRKSFRWDLAISSTVFIAVLFVFALNPKCTLESKPREWEPAAMDQLRASLGICYL